MKLKMTNRRQQIEQARSSMLVVVTTAAAVSVFCLVGIKSQLSQANYQRHILNAQHAATKQLQTNLSSANSLVNYYNTVFEGTSAENVLGGKNTMSANAVPPDGDNARLVLNALPASYDFPALISSVSKLLSQDRISNFNISGSDQSTTISSGPSPQPAPTEIALGLTGSASYKQVRALIKDLERSTRPYAVSRLQLAGDSSNMTFDLSLKTYFQSAKKLDISTEVVK